MNPDFVNSSVALAEIFGRDPLELWLLGLLVAVMLGALGRAAWSRREARASADEAEPFLVFPVSPVHRPMTPAPVQASDGDPPEAGGPEEAEDGTRSQAFRPSNPAHSLKPFRGPFAPASAQQLRSAHPLLAQPSPEIETVLPAGPKLLDGAEALSRPYLVDDASETIRLPTASDGTVQLLPGMLTMVQGPEVGREYRFLRMGNQLVPEVTIGRTNGPAYRHIQIPAATVSRMHARIRYQDGRWGITNLSTINPLLLNGNELRTTEESVLMDGDRIQLGEVELSYSETRQ